MMLRTGQGCAPARRLRRPSATCHARRPVQPSRECSRLRSSASSRVSGFLFARRNHRDPFSWRPIMKTEDVKALAESALDVLAAQLESGQSAALRSYLAAMAQFHRYSINNVLLIQSQRPGATRVAGFATWGQVGRFVR